MNWYNPLKPHIVELDTGHFAVRRFDLGCTSWKYYDNQRYGNDTHWWYRPKKLDYFAVDSLERAQSLLALSLRGHGQFRVKKVHP
jgi:hypothetical protein